MPRGVNGGTLLFDGDCGFCTRSRGWLARLDRRGRVRTVPSQRPGVAERAGLTTWQLADSVWWLADAGGPPVPGAAAVNHALGAALGTNLLIHCYRLPGVARAQEAVYRWVAARRGRFPGVTPWCTSHPEDCERG